VVAASQIVHVIDDDLDVRQSLAFLLSTAGLAVRVYDSALAFLAAAEAGLQDGCIVSDIRMPGMDGIALLHRLKELKVDLPVIVITGHGDVPLAVTSMKAGAVDFIEKPFDDGRLLSALGAALRRHAGDSARRAEVAAIRQRLHSLSGREREVLALLANGKPNKVMAHEFGISVRTVEIYRANVMVKMQADSLSDLVKMTLIGAEAA
jgi:two-component system response regulator FixJ